MADRFRMGIPPMRPQLEVRHAHETLLYVLSDQRLAEEIIPDEEVRGLRMALDCLCWVLHHDVDIHPDARASNFGSMLQYLRSELEEADAKLGAGPPFLEEE